MKLLFCRSCADVRKLNSTHTVACECGKSRGRYLSDGLYAIFTGATAHIIGIDNNSLADAIRQQRQTPQPGADVIAFLFPNGHQRAQRVDQGDRRLQ